MLSREYPNLYIDGRWQEPDSSERLDVISPATGEKIGYVPAANETDIDRAVEAARKAFYETDWPTRPVEERAEIMERLAALIAEHQPEFRDLIVDELGHTKLTAEVYHSVAPTLHWNYYAKVGREHKFAEVREADLSPLAGNAGGLIMKYESKSLLVREPVGVVAAMTAFNFPLPGIAQKTAPALVAGCTVVVKAPDPDPLSLFAMADLVTEAGFPPGVINIVAATREASERLVSHPDVDMVSFTGSVEVGKQIGRACGELIRPCVLELGGKSAAIVLDDADVRPTRGSSASPGSASPSPPAPMPRSAPARRRGSVSPSSRRRAAPADFNPVLAVRAAREVVKVEEAGGLAALVGDVGRIESKAGAQAALDTLQIAEEPRDVSRLARLAAAKGGKTRAIVKLVGRAAIVLSVGAFDLATGSLLGGAHAVRLCLLQQSRGRADDAALSRSPQGAARPRRPTASRVTGTSAQLQPDASEMNSSTETLSRLNGIQLCRISRKHISNVGTRHP